jgi:hypothetical protein
MKRATEKEREGMVEGRKGRGKGEREQNLKSEKEMVREIESKR